MGEPDGAAPQLPSACPSARRVAAQRRLPAIKRWPPPASSRCSSRWAACSRARCRSSCSRAANEQFAFKVIDPATPPKQRDAPKRALVAIVATLAVLIAAWLALRRAPTALLRRGAWWAVGALGLQLLIAVAMILKAFPISLAAGHNAGAALLLMAMLLLNRRLREA
ncbi:MAG: hypothetical protein EBS39_07265 [Gammaproteobacteria bacterium]|nr:hypothetical protein [Gammaproteobacteria bacterium]